LFQSQPSYDKTSLPNAISLNALSEHGPTSEPR
jgi:hypothetical protein